MKFFVVLFLLMSCGTKEQASKLDVVNGVETDRYKSVVSIVMDYGRGTRGHCTGNFITDSVMLTASHCIDEAISVRANGVKSLRIIKNSNYVEDSYNWVTHDVSAVIFPKNTSRYALRISSEPMKNNTPVTLVGFGLTDYQNVNGLGYPSRYSKSGKKHIGYNTYFRNNDINNGILSFNGYGQSVYRSSGTGEFASLGQGDSGGALIWEGKGMVGIASGQRLVGSTNDFENISSYCYLHSASSKRFLNRLKTLGYL